MIDLIAKLPFNPIVFIWTIGALIAVVLNFWLFAQAEFDKDALKHYEGKENPQAMQKIADINIKYSFACFVTALAFFLAGFVAIVVSPQPAPLNPVQLLKGLVTFLAFSYAEFYLIKSGWETVKDRYWLLSLPLKPKDE